MDKGPSTARKAETYRGARRKAARGPRKSLFLRNYRKEHSLMSRRGMDKWGGAILIPGEHKQDDSSKAFRLWMESRK